MSDSVSFMRRWWAVLLGFVILALYFGSIYYNATIYYAPLDEIAPRLETAVSYRLNKLFQLAFTLLPFAFLITVFAGFDRKVTRLSNRDTNFLRVLIPYGLCTMFFFYIIIGAIIPKYLTAESVKLEEHTFELVVNPDTKYEGTTKLFIFECDAGLLRQCELVYQDWHYYDVYSTDSRPEFGLFIRDGMIRRVTITADDEIIGGTTVRDDD